MLVYYEAASGVGLGGLGLGRPGIPPLAPLRAATNTWAGWVFTAAAPAGGHGGSGSKGGGVAALCDVGLESCRQLLSSRVLSTRRGAPESRTHEPPFGVRANQPRGTRHLASGPSYTYYVHASSRNV